MGPFTAIDKFYHDQQQAHSMSPATVFFSNSGTIPWGREEGSDYEMSELYIERAGVNVDTHDEEEDAGVCKYALDRVGIEGGTLPTFLLSNNGFVRSHRQLCSWAAMGPFAATGNFSHGWLWAHSEATLLTGDNGPIRSYRQLYSSVIMGPFAVMDNFSHG